MMSRMLVLLGVLACLLAVVRGQCDTAATETCTLVTMGGDKQEISLTLSFDATGQICAVTGSLTGGTGFTGQQISITGFTDTGNTLVANFQTTPVTVTSITKLTFATGASTGVNQFSNGATSVTSGGSISGNVATAGGQLLSPFTPTTADTLSAAQSDFCLAAGGGDPFFSGFQGQQYFVKGETGAVLNIVQSFNLQLNAKLIFLGTDTSMLPQEQEELFVLSQMRHAGNPAVPTLPATTYWSHPGNYFGELGVAMVEGHRLYAKPGSYKWGWANVTLDGEELAVSDNYIVLSSDVNTITISRPTTHQITVRTVNVEFSLINSDHFFNIEQSHLEAGFGKYKNFAGIMGKSADGKWRWSQEAEEEATIKSGDLFAFDPMAL